MSAPHTIDIPAHHRIVSVAEMVALERAADARGHSYANMMEIAGQKTAATILAQYGRVSCLILAGPGNNGGDGLVCARYLHEAGANVRVYLWKRRTDAEHDYEGHFGRLATMNVPTAHADDDHGFACLHSWLDSSVVVDALLGTGASRPISGQLADLLAIVADRQRTQHFHVVAVDCASGMNCDTGEISPHTLAPDLTVTFAHAKLGHYQFPAAGYVGRLEVADIGIDPALSAAVRTFALGPDVVRDWLPDRTRNSHKGTFGKIMLAVGSESFPGAPYLACAAAGRAGAGLVTGALIRPVWSLVAAKLPEPTYVLLPQAEGNYIGYVDGAAAGRLGAALPGYDALVVGCGLGNVPPVRAFIQNLLDMKLPPTLFDADALNCLAQIDGWWLRLPQACVLTPHPAEMGRLTGLPVRDIVARRWEVAKEKAVTWGCVVLLKGPYTVVAAPTGELAVLPVATPALATAGSGDVLSGLIGGLLAQGLDPFRAACLGAWLHGMAGVRCEHQIGAAGVVASDLLPQLPAAMQLLRASAGQGDGTVGDDS
ncbi:MAG: NAD(P)H-hydrate dehydratase [Caldilineaceae bacterium]|nr:NAD(P)H-hydrate dehydratase [Caldilineaceae bacterium]